MKSVETVFKTTFLFLFVIYFVGFLYLQHLWRIIVSKKYHKLSTILETQIDQVAIKLEKNCGFKEHHYPLQKDKPVMQAIEIVMKTADTFYI